MVPVVDWAHAAAVNPKQAEPIASASA